MDDPADFWARVQVRERGAPGYLKSEELVRALRAFLAHGDRPSAHRIADELLDRWARLVLLWAWKWFPHSDVDRQDLRQEVWSRLWQELANPQKRFWEQNFLLALSHLCIDVRRALTRPGKWLNYTLFCQDGEDDAPDGRGVLDLVDPSADPLAQLLRVERAAWLVQAFPTLP